MNTPSKLFGSPARTDVLLSVALLEETYPSEIARVAELSQFTVQRILDDLEREGIVMSRRVGNNRMVSLNQRRYAVRELNDFLIKYARQTPIEAAISSLRRRPRRRGKTI